MLLPKLSFLKISSLKATVLILFILLLKSNLLRIKGGIIGGFVALTLIAGLIVSSSAALGALAYIYKLNKDKKTEEEIDLGENLQTVDV
tara:strand:+ start:379 stop:645 length:267 start_codon:yes stop_codon:yes gene_type:complete